MAATSSMEVRSPHEGCQFKDFEIKSKTLLGHQSEGPEGAGLSKLASNTELFIPGKILFTLLQFWVRIARCNSEIRPLILALCLLH